ncbi:MAG TPA: hypothetical protein VEJ63_17020, partial [Planctomycetota bacterium]|nr:hypothetical protein [Planctomycetota bacterium]
MTRSRWLLAASFVTLLVAALWSRTETPRAPVAPALAGTKAEPDNIVAQRFPRTPDLVAIRANFDGTLAPEIKLSTPDPKSRWRNPAKPVETTFPEKFTDPVRVRCGIADVLARPLNGNAESRAKTLPDGSLVYEDAFEGADVHYRCSAFKTEEFIVVHEVVSPPLEGGGRG